MKYNIHVSIAPSRWNEDITFRIEVDSDLNIEAIKFKLYHSIKKNFKKYGVNKKQ